MSMKKVKCNIDISDQDAAIVRQYVQWLGSQEPESTQHKNIAQELTTVNIGSQRHSLHWTNLEIAILHECRRCSSSQTTAALLFSMDGRRTFGSARNKIQGLKQERQNHPHESNIFLHQQDETRGVQRAFGEDELMQLKEEQIDMETDEKGKKQRCFEKTQEPSEYVITTSQRAFTHRISLLEATDGEEDNEDGKNKQLIVDLCDSEVVPTNETISLIEVSDGEENEDEANKQLIVYHQDSAFEATNDDDNNEEGKKDLIQNQNELFGNHTKGDVLTSVGLIETTDQLKLTQRCNQAAKTAASKMMKPHVKCRSERIYSDHQVCFKMKYTKERGDPIMRIVKCEIQYGKVLDQRRSQFRMSMPAFLRLFKIRKDVDKWIQANTMETLAIPIFTSNNRRMYIECCVSRENGDKSLLFLTCMRRDKIWIEIRRINLPIHAWNSLKQVVERQHHKLKK